MEPTLDTITLELVDDVLAELEAVAPTLEELAERADALLSVATWDEAAEAPPSGVLRLYSELVRLSVLLAGAAA